MRGNCSQVPFPIRARSGLLKPEPRRGDRLRLDLSRRPMPEFPALSLRDPRVSFLVTACGQPGGDRGGALTRRVGLFPAGGLGANPSLFGPPRTCADAEATGWVRGSARCWCFYHSAAPSGDPLQPVSRTCASSLCARRFRPPKSRPWSWTGAAPWLASQRSRPLWSHPWWHLLECF